MSEVAPILKPPSRSDRYVQLARFVRVFSATEFKLKYGESALGYLWTLAKPLAMFAILYFVFGHVVKIQVGFIDYPIYLLVGIVLWTFFVDATTSTIVSLIVEGSLLRKLRFPRIVIPVSTTMTATLTLLINLVAICVVIALKAIVPHGDWVLLLVLQLTEDIRRIILYRDSPGAIVTAPDVLGTVGRLYPLAIEESKLPHDQRTTFKEYFLHLLKRVSYERNVALAGVTFSVQRGEFFGVSESLSQGVS